MKKKHSVYLLIKDGNPIYVGCSSNVISRIRSHRFKGKEFDKYIILKVYDSKRDALLAENAIIHFISLYGSENWLNAKYLSLAFQGMANELNQKL